MKLVIALLIVCGSVWAQAPDVLLDEQVLTTFGPVQHSFGPLQAGSHYYFRISGVYYVTPTGEYDAWGHFLLPDPPYQYNYWWFWNGVHPSPTPNAYSSDHVYRFPFQSAGGTETISFIDDPYWDNSGSLLVQLWQDNSCSFTTLPFLDNFDSPELESCWTWIREDASHWSLTERPGWMRIVAQEGHYEFGNDENVVSRPRPNGDYQIGTRLAINPQCCYNGGALLIHQDAQNFVALVRLASSTQQVLFQGHTNDNLVVNTFVNVPDTLLHLRIDVQGASATGYWSADGITWMFVAQAQLPWITSSGTEIALSAEGGPPDIPADFDFFHVTADEYFLPVELISFTATPGDGRVALNWSTGSESNVSHFQIDRDGVEVAHVEAVNRPTGNAYVWLDTDVTNGQSYSYTLTAVDLDGSRVVHGTVEATPRAVALPAELTLAQNYPNPFNASTTIEFSLPEAENVSLRLFNLSGQEVAVLADGVHEAGRHAVQLNANDLSSGIYFYRLESAQRSIQQKMVLLK